MSNKSTMCIVNLDLVDDIADLAGSQSDIMRRLNISWNSWIKVMAGIPIRLSVGKRLKQRVLTHAYLVDGFRQKYPLGAAGGGIDIEALDRAFLRPANAAAMLDMQALYSLRSVRRARDMRPGIHS